MSDLIEIYADEIFRPDKRGPAITTVGTFDGVHLGHRKILDRVSSGVAKTRVRTVVTFEPHPQNVMRHRPGIVPILTSTPEKVRILRSIGIDRVYILRFTKELARVTAEEFLTRILIGELNTEKLVVGYNHFFGRNRKGNSEFLESVKDRYGFDLEVVGPHNMAGETISSTKIRRILQSGDVEKAAQFLGRKYRLAGRVIPGVGRGRTLNFPTANLELTHPEKLIPPKGVYAAIVEVDDQMHPGMVNIGIRPTFGESKLTIEVHLINFDGDLYDQSINLLFLKRIRDEEKFESAQALTSRIMKDRDESLRVFEANLPDTPTPR